jgi:hypothetical protein
MNEKRWLKPKPLVEKIIDSIEDEITKGKLDTANIFEALEAVLSYVLSHLEPEERTSTAGTFMRNVPKILEITNRLAKEEEPEPEKPDGSSLH